MTTINHGEWTEYVPDKWPEGVPVGINVIFARRTSDGVDWYEYLKTAFKPDTVKMTVMDVDNNRIVMAVTRNVQRLFPARCSVIELESSDSNNPQADYGGKVYNPDTGTFSALPLPPPQPTIAELLARIEALEKR